MSFLKNIFKSKPGGIVFGNAFRGIVGLAATAGVPGAAAIQGMIPAAPPAVVDTFTQSLASVAALPAQNFNVAQQLGFQAAQQAATKGASQEEQDEISRQVAVVAQKPADEILVAELGGAPAGANSLTSQDLKNIGGKILEGAKSGAVEGFMETEEGKSAKKEAVDQQLTSLMPIALCITVILLIWQKFKKG